MQKSNFIKTFEITRLFGKIGLISIGLGLSLILISSLVQNDMLLHTQHFKLVTSYSGYCFCIFGIVNFLITSPLVIREINDRLLNDNLKNYGKSILKTMMLRHFLKKNEIISVLSKDGKNSLTSNKKITRQFNHWLNHSVVDIRHDRIAIMMVIPPSHQAQKQLQDMLFQIKEQICSTNTDYYISGPIREKHLYWFIGERR